MKLDDLDGLYHRQPRRATLLLIFMLSLGRAFLPTAASWASILFFWR